MTAEVLILNKSAVALAADSAATVGEGDTGKIHKSVNKLFTLSKHRPVGVMIYQNADYMGIPFETIIKVYRESLGRTGASTVEEYSDQFIAYLSGPMFSTMEQQANNVRHTWQAVFDEIGEDIRRQIRAEIQSKGDCPTRRQKQVIEDVSRFHLSILEKAEIAVGFEGKDPTSVLAEYSNEFDAAKNTVWLPPAPNDAVERIWKEIAGLAITRKHEYSHYSGVIITGFGENEFFPRYAATKVSGISSGVHKCEVMRKAGIDNASESIIAPFAQREMVTRFMEGVDVSYESFIGGATSQALFELANAIIDVHVSGSARSKGKIRKAVMASIATQMSAFSDSAKKWRRSRFVDPVLDAVANLPKDELANLAEALVDLTSIKRRVSTERETVGGPIDVAVISKGDGFIWIKRKHYFRPELNPHFFANYRGLSRKEDIGGT